MARKHDKRSVASSEVGPVYVVSARVAGKRFVAHFAGGVSASIADRVRRVLASIKPREGYAWAVGEIGRMVAGRWRLEGEC